MQRVAIARALVNDPEILLADEPTGALDSETSVQIMELLSEIAKDRLVIMVTHNPELAQRYSTRIIRLLDGRVIDDSDPYSAPAAPQPAARPKGGRREKTSMSVFTALSLSLNNLLTNIYETSDEAQFKYLFSQLQLKIADGLPFLGLFFRKGTLMATANATGFSPVLETDALHGIEYLEFE